jgi:hypothetical protein
MLTPSGSPSGMLRTARRSSARRSRWATASQDEVCVSELAKQVAGAQPRATREGMPEHKRVLIVAGEGVGAACRKGDGCGLTDVKAARAGPHRLPSVTIVGSA